MSTDSKTDTVGEALPLLCNAVERRPYQAYCATETSSCPPSPESLVPSPLRITKIHSQQVNTDTPASDIDASGQNTSLVRAATFSLDKHLNLARVIATKKYSKKQTKGANQKGMLKCTASATSDHITQSVTARGSHLLAAEDVTTYHQTPSRSRMQLELVDCATEHLIPRKPVPHEGQGLGSSCRPLPPVPFEEVALEDLISNEPIHEDGHVAFQPQKPTLADKMLEVQDNQRVSTSCQSVQNISDEPLLDSCDYTAAVEPDLAFEKSFPTLNLESTQCNTRIHEAKPTARSGVYDKAQPPLPTELHIPYDPSSDIFTPMMPGCTQTGDKDLAYPPPRLSRVPPPPQSPDVHIPPLNSTHIAQRHPTPSFYSCSEPHNGPRPPPWGSYDTLTLQRRQRSAYREQAQHVGNGVATDTTTMTYFFPKTPSTYSLSKHPSREVQEYRDQILSVYPDMAFGGDTGGDGRLKTWVCCCLVM